MLVWQFSAHTAVGHQWQMIGFCDVGNKTKDIAGCLADILAIHQLYALWLLQSPVFFWYYFNFWQIISVVRVKLTIASTSQDSSSFKLTALISSRTGLLERLSVTTRFFSETYFTSRVNRIILGNRHRIGALSRSMLLMSGTNRRCTTRLQFKSIQAN